MRIFAVIAVAVAALSAPPAWAENSVHASDNAYAFEFTAIDGGALSLADYRGRAMLIVNTASLCGFTDQYNGLQTLYEQYADQGFVVIGVPSNDFGGQEPGKASEIKSFCETNFNIRFPLADKTAVSGQDAHPFYVWAASRLGKNAAPKWNFHKYLIDRDGDIAASFPSAVDPLSPKIAAAVQAALVGRESVD
ncbi:MAG: redoxin domain-containing protein [Alphaproteobacteria bacterium]|nr:redoxin domain-containing protein [Alphaproteobacteria bacterium]